MTKEKEPKEEKKLEIELLRVDNILFGRIKEQPACLRNTSLNFYSSEKFGIISSGEPQLSFNTLYIRGTIKQKDFRTFFYQYASPEEAKKYGEQLRKAVEEINEKKPFETPEKYPEPLKCEKIMG